VPEGAYSGVTLSGGDPPATTKVPPEGLAAVTWPGFRSSQEGSEVFLQLTGDVTYKDRLQGNRIIITLDKTTVLLKNNRRPVVTRASRDTRLALPAPIRRSPQGPAGDLAAAQEHSPGGPAEAGPLHVPRRVIPCPAQDRRRLIV